MKETGANEKGRGRSTSGSEGLRPPSTKIGTKKDAVAVGSLQGTIKWLRFGYVSEGNKDKPKGRNLTIDRYGVITPDDGTKDLFVHVRPVGSASPTRSSMKSGKVILTKYGKVILKPAKDESQVSSQDIARLESSVDKMIVAADLAISKIDLAIQRIAKKRKKISALKTINIRGS